MSTPLSPYQSSFTPTFDKQLTTIERKDKIRGSRIRKKMSGILANPYEGISFATGIYRGRREDRAGKDRLIFVVCKQCRDEKHVKFNMCSDCHKTVDETVVWVMIIEDHKY
ncbi:hypothetical protein D4R54_00915 [archaeon]|nr:MAG: hypothetical protein D4R54_00915 [archaeon]